MFRILLTSIPLLLAAVLMAGCGQPEAAAKRYPMKGTVKAVDSKAKTATIDAGKIGDWMEPMTMEYAVKPESELAKLHPGDRIEATVVVKDPSYFVTDIRVVGTSAP